jgi:hypothetical protein
MAAHHGSLRRASYGSCSSGSLLTLQCIQTGLVVPQQTPRIVAGHFYLSSAYRNLRFIDGFATKN